MLMKIMGATALVVSSGLYGIYSGRKLENSLAQVKDLRSGLNMLKQEIYLNSATIGTALQNVSQLMTTDMRDVFFECGNSLRKQCGISFQECMLSCINNLKIDLDSESKSILFQWSAKAGTGDRNSELNSLEYVMSQLDQHIENAEERCAKLAKLYKNCGFLVGAFIVAVLI